MSSRSVSYVLLSPKHASPRDHIVVRIHLSKLHEYPLIKGVSLFYNAKSKESLNKWMKYVNLSESACCDIPVPIVKGDALVVGGCTNYDLEQLYSDFPNIKELVGQCHAGVLQRTNGQEEMKRKRTDVMNKIEYKKLQSSIKRQRRRMKNRLLLHRLNSSLMICICRSERQKDHCTNKNQYNLIKW
jgi:hypothetical protein